MFVLKYVKEFFTFSVFWGKLIWNINNEKESLAEVVISDALELYPVVGLSKSAICEVIEVLEWTRLCFDILGCIVTLQRSELPFFSSLCFEYYILFCIYLFLLKHSRLKWNNKKYFPKISFNVTYLDVKVLPEKKKL